MKMLKNFKIDYSRCKVVVPTRYYQMDAMYALEHARKTNPELLTSTDLYPSWAQAFADPFGNSGFIVSMLQAMFLGRHNLPAINIAKQTRKIPNVSMVFVSAGMTNEKFSELISVAESALPGWQIVGLYGDAEYFNKSVGNANSEPIVKKIIENADGKNVVIFSKGMAARSFSQKEITTVALCYDNGEAGATQQRYSRALTPWDENKVANIISMSFDPNRDDTFDDDFLITARKRAAKKGIDMPLALREVLQTVDLLSCTPNGAIKIDIDTYLPQLLQRNTMARLTGRQVDIGLITEEELIALKNGDKNYNPVEKQKTPPLGNTFVDKKPKSKGELRNVKDNSVEQARRAIVTIANNFYMLCHMTQKFTVSEVLEACINDTNHRNWFINNFNIQPTLIKSLVDRGAINYEYLSLETYAKVNYNA